MLRVFRINLVCLLTLLQLVAPLLHAHGGGNPVNDRLHLPGLEFLAAQNPEFSASSAHDPALGEFIVGVAQGCEYQLDHGLSSPEASLFSPARSFASAASTLTGFEANAPPATFHLRPDLSHAVPRAPPQFRS